MKIINESISTPVTHTCDVLVAGGGFGGISAALAAAREGKRVILLDRGFMLGGLATAGLVTIYLPLCDGYGRQVSFGIAEELLRLAGAVHLERTRGAENWLLSEDKSKRGEEDPRFEIDFNAQLFAMQAEKLLIDNGVKILYGTYAVSATVDGDKMSAVIAENKSGRFAIEACSFVDATGDADLAKLSGAPTALFEQGNVLAAWYYYHGNKGYGLNMLGFCDIPDEMKGDDYKENLLVNRRFKGIEGDEISEMMQLSHARIMQDVIEQRTEDDQHVPVTIATIPQIRMTRRIDGEYTLDSSEMHKYFADSIGMVSDWRRRGPVYEVPFGTLYSAKMKNLIMAGRCTSVTDGMWDIMRVIPCCAVTGEAAGIAAAMTDDFTSLDITVLQSRLASRGVRLHESDLD